MSATKPSNLLWLGQVPEHWEVKRADALLEEQRKVLQPETFSGKNVFHYSIPSIQETGDGTVEEGETIASAKTHITQDVLLVSKLNPRKGTVLIGRPRVELTVCSGEFIPLVARGCDLHYAEYVYRSEEVRQQLDAAVRSVTRSHQRATPEDIRKITWAWPPLPEQRAIAAYLDARTARIDGLVARQRRLVQLLKEKRQALITRAVTRGLNPNAKMKDSGVPWLGEVPVGWEVKRIRYCFRFQSGGTPSTTKEEYWDGDLPWVSAKDMKVLDLHDTQDHIAEFALAESAANKVPEGTLLVLTRSGILQHTLPVSVNTREVAINQDVKGCIPAIDLNALFAAYWIHGLQDQLLNIWRQEGATVESLDFETVKDTLIPIPERHEQDRIVDYIRRRTLQIDTLITKVEQAVERLQEYRTALISAAVTGKVRVPQ